MGYHALLAPPDSRIMHVKSLSKTGRVAIVRGLLLALILCGHAAVSQAEELYETQVPVSGQQDRERARALRVAFEQVLLKVTGHRDTAQAPAVESALRQPMGYVQQFRYLPLADDGTGERMREDGYRELLRVSFDVNAVNQMLQAAGVPLWGRTRPVTLMWLAVEDQGGRWLLGGDIRPDFRDATERAARARGIPVLLPLMDLEDRRELHFTDVWGNFQDSLLRASARYQPGAVLVGRLLHGPDGGWTGRWSLYHDGNVDHWSVGGDGWNELLASGIDGAADLLATRHARVITPDGHQFIDIVITEIRDIAGYERAMKYLRELDPVERLQVVGLEADRVRFRLALSGDSDTLVRLIGFGSALVPIPVSSASGRPHNAQGREGVQELSYRLLP